ncbi:MAG: flagellar basal body L-ring protein FlgH [Henriciella sp.]|nr:flagellar basal body L-ring protein FlgH [Henriciella sp.]
MKILISTSAIAMIVTACATTPQTDADMAHLPAAMPAAALATAQDQAPQIQNASLWATTPNALLSMRRAKAVGDLLTVVVEIND